MTNNRFTDQSGFEEVPSEIEKALALVPEYEASKEEGVATMPVIPGNTP